MQVELEHVQLKLEVVNVVDLCAFIKFVLDMCLTSTIGQEQGGGSSYTLRLQVPCEKVQIPSEEVYAGALRTVLKI